MCWQFPSLMQRWQRCEPRSTRCEKARWAWNRTVGSEWRRNTEISSRTCWRPQGWSKINWMNSGNAQYICCPEQELICWSDKVWNISWKLICAWRYVFSTKILFLWVKKIEKKIICKVWSFNWIRYMFCLKWKVFNRKHTFTVQIQ